MSGRKYSQFELQKEREEKIRLLQTIRTLKAETNALRNWIRNRLTNTSPGLLETFQKEVQAAQIWLESSSNLSFGKEDISSSLSLLRNIQKKLGEIVAKGKVVQEELSVAFTKKADAMGSSLAREYAEIENLVIRRKELLGAWFGEAQVRDLEERLEESKALLANKQYVPLQQILAHLRNELNEKITEAEKQEEKHQKRLYLLKALRQVCVEMGFNEVEPPRYEEPGVRGSRIILTVDTFDKGKIRFSLGLDTISSFSEISEDRCFEDFDKLSQALDDEFGIKTEFRREDGTRPPKLIRKGEMDLPSDTGMQAQK